MIDISTLPSLQLSSKGDLPVAPGVYVVMDGNSVLYVGKATNLRRRWSSHHRFSQICHSFSNPSIRWIECASCADLDELESSMISILHPCLNNTACLKSSEKRWDSDFPALPEEKETQEEFSIFAFIEEACYERDSVEWEIANRF